MEIITKGSKSIILYCNNRVEITYTRDPKYRDKSIKTYGDKLQFHDRYIIVQKEVTLHHISMY